jgi:hypothetical protein
MRWKVQSLLLAACALTAASHAAAQEFTDDAAPRFADGKLMGCEYIYSTSFRDTAYAGGRPLLATGSANIYVSTTADGSLAPYWVLKLGVGELNSEADRPLSSLFLIAGNRTNHGERIHFGPSDGPGHYVAFFEMGVGSVAALDEFAATGEVTIGYSVGEGRTSQQIKIAATSTAKDRFFDCTADLAELLPE